jgi:hypothetical protein
MLKRVWKDPVWSKVIAAGIIAVASLLIVLLKSVVDKIPFQSTLKGFFDGKIRILWVVAGILLFLILRSIYQNNSLKWKKRQFVKSVKKLENHDLHILYKFTIEFEGDYPTIENLKIFCTLHEDLPLGFIDFKCPIYNCNNSRQALDEVRLINFLESILLDMWEKSIDRSFKVPAENK